MRWRRRRWREMEREGGVRGGGKGEREGEGRMGVSGDGKGQKVAMRMIRM